MIKNSFSQPATVFHVIASPKESGSLVGYAAVINYYNLNCPLPHCWIIQEKLK